VGAMELALITEKARSLSNYILDKLLKYFQLEFYLIEVLSVKGTGTRDYNSVFMAWFDRSWLAESPADIHNFFNSASNFILS
jgi:hypothetical protein